MRTLILAVTGLVFSVAACSSYGTSVIETQAAQRHAASVFVSVPRSLQAGQTARASATVKDSTGVILTGRQVAWFTSTTSIATVNDSGTVAALAPGDVQVSAVSDGVAGQAALSVIAPPPTPTPVARVMVAINPGSVIVGQTAHATGTPMDASGNPLSGLTLTWQTSNAAVASVAASGDVSAVGAGTATISASTQGVTGVAALTVNVQPSVPVSSVTVSPPASTLQVAGTVQLSAVTRDANSNVLNGRVITWNSPNTAIARVSSSGLVTAVAAGSVSITATSEGQSASAAITVSASAPAPVATVSVSPTSSSLLVGATVQLSATMRDANNNVLTGRVVTWSSANTSIASVSSTGLVRGVGAGSTTITATSETKTGTATENVQAPPPPPPPPPPGSSNEPTGMSLLNERSFNSVTEDASWIMQGSSVAQDATAPKSPSNVLRASFPAGFAGGSSPINGELSHAGHRVLYISYWAKYSSNWQGHLTGVNKQIYEWAGGNPIFYFEAYGVGGGNLTPRVVLQGTPADNVFSPNLVSNATIPRGQWFQVEIVLGGNSSGAADGSIDWYLNGVHIGSQSGLRWTSGATSWGIFSLRPIWGGVGDNVSSTQTFDVDHLYISGKN